MIASIIVLAFFLNLQEVYLEKGEAELEKVPVEGNLSISAEKKVNDHLTLEKYRKSILTQTGNKKDINKTSNRIKEPQKIVTKTNEKEQKSVKKAKVNKKQAKKISEKSGNNNEKRYNFASIDSGASLLSFSEGAKEAQTILARNDDKYMMMPSDKPKWFVVQLSEDIMVEKVEIKNLEHYSSSIKTLSVFSSSKWPNEKWNFVGEFLAEDNKNVQTFGFKKQFWARFLRIEITSHYRKEFFCTLTQFNVYGSTMIERFHEEMEEISEEVKIAKETIKKSNGKHSEQNDSKKIEFGGITSFGVKSIVEILENERICLVDIKDIKDVEILTLNNSKEIASKSINCSNNFTREEKKSAFEYFKRENSHKKQNYPIANPNEPKQNKQNDEVKTNKTDVDKEQTNTGKHLNPVKTPNKTEKSNEDKKVRIETDPAKASGKKSESIFKSLLERIKSIEISTSISNEYIENRSREFSLYKEGVENKMKLYEKTSKELVEITKLRSEESNKEELVAKLRIVKLEERLEKILNGLILTSLFLMTNMVLTMFLLVYIFCKL